MLFSTVNGTTKKVGQEAESEPLMMPWSHQALLGDDHDDEYEYDEKPEKKREVDAFNSGGNQNSMWNMWNGLCVLIWGAGIALAFYDMVTMQNRVVLPGGHIDIGRQKGRLSKTTLTRDLAKDYVAAAAKKEESSDSDFESTDSDSSSDEESSEADRRLENINQLLFLLEKASDTDIEWTCRNPVDPSQFKKEALKLRVELQSDVHYDDDVKYDLLVRKADTCGQSFPEGPRMLAVLDKLVLFFNRGRLPKCALWKLKWSIRLVLLLFWTIVGYGAYLLCTKLSSEGGLPLGPYIAIVGMSALVYVILGFTVVDDKLGGPSLYPKNPCSLHTTLLILGVVAVFSFPFLYIYWSHNVGKTFGVSWLHAGAAAVVLSLLYFFFGYGIVEYHADNYGLSMYKKVSCHCFFICLIVGFCLIPVCKYLLEYDLSTHGFDKNAYFLFGLLVIVAFMILTRIIAGIAVYREMKPEISYSFLDFLNCSWTPTAYGFIALLILAVIWFSWAIHYHNGQNIWVETKYAFGLPMWSILIIIVVCAALAYGAYCGTGWLNQAMTGESKITDAQALNKLRWAFCGVFVVVMFLSIFIVTALDKFGFRDPVDVACIIWLVFYVLWSVVHVALVNKFITNYEDLYRVLFHTYAFSTKLRVFHCYNAIPFAVILAFGFMLTLLQAFSKNRNTDQKIVCVLVFVGLCFIAAFLVQALGGWCAVELLEQNLSRGKRDAGTPEAPIATPVLTFQ